MKKPGFWSRRRDRDLDDEIRSHLEMAVRERVERGEDPAEAANSARREFGNVGLVKEAAQQEWGWVWLDQLMQDTRHGLRILRLEPGFTVAAVLTLALGIGATSLVFSVVESVLLKSLPYPDAGRLMLIHESLPKAPQLNVSWPDFQDLRAQTKVFEDIAAFQVPGNVTMAASSGPKTVQVNYVSPSLFSMLGIRPVLGRTFADDEDKAGSGLPAVVSYRFWRDELGGDQNAIGRTLLLNGGSIPIIGILPPAPKYEPWGADVHFPIGFLANSPNFSDRGNHPGIVAIGRRRPGASLSQTQMDMDRIMNLLGDEYPASNRGEQVVLSDLNEWMTGGYRTELLMLLAGVGLVLLLASANVANLLLSRSVKRDQEFAVRAALGASPARIARQLIVESLIISLIGGAAGILLASAAMAPLVRLSPYNIPRLDEAHLDARVLLVALGLSLATGLIFGVAPAFQPSTLALVRSLNDRGAGARSARRIATARSGLLVVEIAIAFVVAVLSGLLVRSILMVMKVDPGFRADSLLAVNLSYQSSDQNGAPGVGIDYFNNVLDRVRNLPGVESASAVMCPPLEGIRWTSPYLSDNHDTTPPSQRPQTVLNMTEPSYFETMKIRLVEGRYFTAHDGSSSPLVVIINQALANRVWPGRSAIGRQLYVQENWREVVGVVGGTKQFGLEFRTMPEAFLPDAQLPVNFMTVVVRTSTDPRNMVKTLADTIQSVDGAQSVPAPYPVTEKLSEVLARRGFLTLLLASFGILGLALAAVGVFGVASYQVARQTQEIGVRMALGARRSSVVWLVLRKGLLRGFGGVVVGLAGALATTRLLSTVLFGVKPIDPVTFAGVVIVVLAVTAAACWIPALRASRVDPVLSLRRE